MNSSESEPESGEQFFENSILIDPAITVFLESVDNLMKPSIVEGLAWHGKILHL